MKKIAGLMVILTVLGAVLVYADDFEDRIDVLIAKSEPDVVIRDAITYNSNENYPLAPIKYTLEQEIETLLLDMGIDVGSVRYVRIPNHPLRLKLRKLISNFAYIDSIVLTKAEDISKLAAYRDSF
ncbi:hypothetical protein LQZ21_02525 [Treponema sp. TIM-1]|uniref:hypothetical protein n=1 Tax=Treponema sp. TIM-1 TaxID=2898417 RepID=UPI00397F5723